MESIAALIKQLELRLLQTDLRTNPTLIDELIAESFEEINSAGQINSRQQVVEWLMNKDSNQNWILKDFRIRPLTNHMVIAIYSAVNDDQVPEKQSGSIRSSIWQCQNDHWKMVFHQATKRI